MSQKAVERRALKVSLVMNALITAAGVWVFALTRIQALFLDCFYSFAAMLSTAFALMISRLSGTRTETYPDGRLFLEPLYGVLKALAIMILLVYSLIRTGGAAFRYFTTGAGTPMYIGPVLPYTAAMVILCFGLCWFNRRQNRKIHGISSMLAAEAKTNLIDGLQSLGVGVCVLALYFIPIDHGLGFLHYTADFFITLLLTLLSWREPRQILSACFRELTGGVAGDKGMERRIVAAVRSALPVEGEVRVYKTGMYLRVEIRPVSCFPEMEEIRKALLDQLKPLYENLEILYYF